MIKHYVTFLSPGTIVPETTTKEIPSWDIELAKEMSKGILERYSALPYGFYFTTRERNKNDFDSKQIKQSHMYYLGGIVETLEEIKTRNDPEDKTLIRNMEINEWEKVIVNTNSWKVVIPLTGDEEIV